MRIFSRIFWTVCALLAMSALFGLIVDLNQPGGVITRDRVLHPPAPTATPLPTATPSPTDTPTAVPTPTLEPSAMPTIEELLAALAANGIRLTNVQYNPPIDVDSPLPRSYRYNVTWHDAVLGTAGGQFFICDEPYLCAVFQSYFEALVVLAGPYTYTSPSGLVVFQLNRAFTPDQAARYQKVLEQY